MKNFGLTLSAATMLFLACGNPANEKKEKIDTIDSSVVVETPLDQQVPFAVANNYFIKNDVSDDKNGVHKIENQADFDAIFAPAATMGDNGMPTAIDFSKEYVIAIISKTSDLNPQIDQITLKRDGTNLLLDYKETVGEKQSYSIRPAAVMIVDKQYQGDINVRSHETL